MNLTRPVVERLALVRLVVGFGELRRDPHEFHADDLQALLLEAGEDLAASPRWTASGLRMMRVRSMPEPYRVLSGGKGARIKAAVENVETLKP